MSPSLSRSRRYRRAAAESSKVSQAFSQAGHANMPSDRAGTSGPATSAQGVAGSTDQLCPKVTCMWSFGVVYGGVMHLACANKVPGESTNVPPQIPAGDLLYACFRG